MAQAELATDQSVVRAQGFTLWLTGLSGAGKSTLAAAVATALRRHAIQVEILDGDEVRQNLSKGLGFSREDRDTNIRRIGYVAKLLTRNGVVVITAAISPYPAEVRERAAALRDAQPESIVAWTLENFPRKTALTVSFGGGGVVLAHIVSRVNQSVPVFFLDTGFHFPETLAFKERFVARYGLNLVELHPHTDPGPLYQTDPDRCCWIRKVEPLERALAGFNAWVSAVRRDQSETRAETEVLEYHE